MDQSVKTQPMAKYQELKINQFIKKDKPVREKNHQKGMCHRKTYF